MSIRTRRTPSATCIKARGGSRAREWLRRCEGLAVMKEDSGRYKGYGMEKFWITDTSPWERGCRNGRPGMGDPEWATMMVGLTCSALPRTGWMHLAESYMVPLRESMSSSSPDVSRLFSLSDPRRVEPGSDGLDQ